ncbi:metallophosphoesterase [Thermoproteota archaeon]
MILGILADSHDNLPKLKKAVSLFNKIGVNFVLHAGDYIAPFAVGMLENNLSCGYRGVFGNCDGEKDGLIKRSNGKIKDHILDIEHFGKKILVIHDISKAAAELSNYDIVISGHTHEVSVEKKNGTWFINPGECGGWLKGKSTVVTFDIISDRPKIHRL